MIQPVDDEETRNAVVINYDWHDIEFQVVCYLDQED